MVSTRCKMIVKAELERIGYPALHIELGEVDLSKKLPERSHELLRIALGKSDLELMNDKKAILVEKIKNVIVEMVHYADELPKTNFSYYLSEKLNYDYTYLSNLFSEVKGITIERFIIAHKIEKVKEMLVYNELTLSSIAVKMQYSSVSHLSSQFRKVTGLTPSHFKKMKQKRVTGLENL